MISTALIVKIVVAAVIIAAAGIAAAGITRTVRRRLNSAEARIIKEIVGTASQGFSFDEAQNAPRKVSNMNKIYLPMLEKDFPSFSWSEMKRTVERAVKEKYRAEKDFTIHETAVSRYDKTSKDAVVRTETSAQYIKDGAVNQILVQTELSYLFYNNNENDAQKGLHALNCPNCGAPLSRNANGELICTYCSALASGEKEWQITEIKEK